MAVALLVRLPRVAYAEIYWPELSKERSVNHEVDPPHLHEYKEFGAESSQEGPVNPSINKPSELTVKRSSH